MLMHQHIASGHNFKMCVIPYRPKENGAPPDVAMVSHSFLSFELGILSVSVYIYFNPVFSDSSPCTI